MEYPQDVRSAVDGLQQLLDDDVPDIRRSAALTLAYVAKEYPEVVQQSVEKLADLLDDAATGEAAESALTAVADGGDIDRVRQAVEDSAPDHLDDVFGDVDTQSTRGLVLACSEGVSVADSRCPDLEAVASPPRQSLGYADLRGAREPIGAGGQGVVYEVTLSGDAQPDRIALKQPMNTDTLAQSTVETFLEEAAVWETVDEREREKPRWSDSEHIVGVIDTGEELPWIAMEYMDGGGLDDRLDKGSDGLPLAEALWIGECICQAVELAHNYGIAHLDLKPANVLFRETSDDMWNVPKVADWGLARVLAEQTGTMEGLSITYAAPEQFEPEAFGDPDMLTDVYQVGALVYSMLTGEAPYTGSQTSIMYDVVQGDGPTAPSTIRSDVPEALDSAVQIALARSKDDRYRSIATFVRALEAIRTGQSLPPVVAQHAESDL